MKARKSPPQVGQFRCAIYTRKSSEEGLDQAFNSLHAQREACEAYVRSQVGEGWIGLPTAYDDGGFSGGNMERPALRQLMADVAAGRIDVIVVYKVDRLTRSLMDFAKIVEVFDAHGVSFVSVTQAFNTTTSMGRLTLNVLLSFAQFEREVTGERIRDKIAASKAKGIWMGGVPPLGYDPKDRALTINPSEADQVRSIFRRYLELKSVPALKAELDRTGVRSKVWTTRRGETVGGVCMSCGALFHLLTNPIYIGKIVHKSEVHAGLHPPIVDEALFDAVAAQLAGNRRQRHQRPTRAAKSPLTGIIFDVEGAPMSPSFAYSSQKRLYRYYVSPAVLPGRARGGEAEGQIRRVSAPALEALVLDRLRRLVERSLLDWEAAEGLLARVEIRNGAVQLWLRQSAMAALGGGAPDELQARLPAGDRVSLERTAEGAALRVMLAVRPVFRGGRTSLEGGGASPATRRQTNAVIVKALRRSHAILLANKASPLAAVEEMANATAPADFNDRRMSPLGFLAPDIQRAILEGRQPSSVTLNALLQAGGALSWEEQRRALGWSA